MTLYDMNETLKTMLLLLEKVMVDAGNVLEVTCLSIE